MSTSSSISSPEELQSRTCKCGFMARYFTATTLENGGRRFYRCRRLGSNSCGYWNWIDDKLPRHVSTMIHNQKVELDSIRKERNHLKKIVEDMGGIEDPYLKDMIADEMSELKDMNENEISDLTKVSALKGKMSNLELTDKIESLEECI
uniref:GRF-type domain-containing protein n=1 Tax=Solanum tuberosum TaxID=4113 RepID=M1BZJ0_SOLTU